VQDEDTQPLSEPIIAAVKSKNFEILEKEIPKTLFNPEFLVGLMDHPQLVRNLAFVGHLHHGKTTFMGILLKYTFTIIFSTHSIPLIHYFILNSHLLTSLAFMISDQLRYAHPANSRKEIFHSK
jgi:hypothetical protein